MAHAPNDHEPRGLVALKREDAGCWLYSRDMCEFLLLLLLLLSVHVSSRRHCATTQLSCHPAYSKAITFHPFYYQCQPLASAGFRIDLDLN